MNFKFTIEEKLERNIETIFQGKEIIMVDQFTEFNLMEGENNPENLYVYYKDIKRDLNIMERYFTIKKYEKESFEKEFALSPTERYKKMLSLKMENTNKEETYKRNKLFFVAANVTLKEWEQF